MSYRSKGLSISKADSGSLVVDVLCIAFAIGLAFGVIVIIALEALPLDILPQLSHEKLEVYQKSIQLLTLSAKGVASPPRG